MLSNGPLSWGFANDIYPREPDVIDNLANTLYDFSKNAGWLRMYEKMAMLDDRGYLMEGFTSTDYQAVRTSLIRRCCHASGRNLAGCLPY